MEYIDASALRNAFLGAYDSLELSKEMVNALNVFPVPDGDTGTNMALTVNSAVKNIRTADGSSMDQVLSSIAKGSLMGARGNSGVILSQLLRGFTKRLEGKKQINTKELALAFKEGSDMAYKAVMKPIEGTILTVAKGCAEKAVELSRTESDVMIFLEGVIDHGNVVLDKTPDMLAILKESGVVDAGGKGLLVMLEGARDALNGKEILGTKQEIATLDSEVRDHSSIYEIEFGYCTEFIIQDASLSPESFRSEIEKYGDSTLVVGSDSMIKVHIHTDNPGAVLEDALKVGNLIDIKIDNMRYQHGGLEKKANTSEPKKYGMVSVSVGRGLEKLFKDLGVDQIISGGQTMNPSTEDILKAIEKIDAENIIVFPNNGNIVLAANQAKEISSKNIEVIATKSVQQGISSLIVFDESLDLEENVGNMIDAYKSIKTGEVTFSVKDTVIDGVSIKRDDIMGIASKKILCTGSSISEVTVKLVESLIDEDTEIVTLFYGQDLELEEAEKLGSIIESKYPDIDIEILEGGQPLYYYLISVE